MPPYSISDGELWTDTGQFAILYFYPWSIHYLIFRTFIYPSQFAIHTISLLGHFATW